MSRLPWARPTHLAIGHRRARAPRRERLGRRTGFEFLWRPAAADQMPPSRSAHQVSTTVSARRRPRGDTTPSFRIIGSPPLPSKRNRLARGFPDRLVGGLHQRAIAVGAVYSNIALVLVIENHVP